MRNVRQSYFSSEITSIIYYLTSVYGALMMPEAPPSEQYSCLTGSGHSKTLRHKIMMLTFFGSF